jgi:hypothetical protein
VSELRNQLREFLIHEETPVDSILANHALDVVFREIESLLVTETPDVIARVLTFVCDAGLYYHPFRIAFRTHLDSSCIWEIFRQLLRAPNCFVRGNVIYTIGKLTCRERSYLLSEAFPFFLEKEPINLARLMFELGWLTNEWNWDFLDQIAAADHYLCRWSLCEILDHDEGPTETMQRTVSILTRLKHDAHPVVAAEANFRLERINVKLRPKLPKPERRKEVKRIADLEPDLTFESVRMRFIQTREDYSLAEFHQFVEQLAPRPLG